MTGAVVVQSRLAPAVDRIIEPMLDLAHCSKLNGIVVAGANSAELMFELRRRALAAASDGLTIVNARQDRSNRGNFNKVISSPIATSWRDGRGDR
jgi:hypothetical protein